MNSSGNVQLLRTTTMKSSAIPFFFFSDVYDQRFAKLIEEGYFKSFSSEVVKKDVIKTLSVAGLTEDVDFEIVGEDELSSPDLCNDMEIFHLAFASKPPKTLVTKIESLLARDGWYLSATIPGEDSFTFICEPTFPISNDHVSGISRRLILKYKKFYHCTFRKYARRIITNGLIPSFGGRSEFIHPERIYLFTNKSMAFKFGDVSLDDETERLLKRKVRGRDAPEKYQDDNEKDIVVFEVNLKKMLDDGNKINLYHDNRWDPSSPVFFTVNSIKPAYLSEISRF